MSMAKHICALPVAARAIVTVCMALMIGVIDYLTGEYGITMLYLLPVYAGAKLLGKAFSRFLLAVCVCELVYIAGLFHPFRLSLVDPYFMNTVLQSVELIITGWIISLLTVRISLSEP